MYTGHIHTLCTLQLIEKGHLFRGMNKAIFYHISEIIALLYAKMLTCKRIRHNIAVSAADYLYFAFVFCEQDPGVLHVSPVIGNIQF